MHLVSKETATLAVTRHGLLDWIFADDFDGRHRTIKSKRVADSGIWFLSHAQFQQWDTGFTSSMLFCPGSGKHSKSFSNINLP
jgi:hypothetical protein